MALARILNTSKTWTVKHQSDEQEIALAHQHHSLMHRFRKDHYGEVSCALLMTLDVLPATRKLVILRDPRDCILSAWNYWHAVEGADFALGLKAEMTFRLIDRLLDEYPYEPYKRLFRNVDGVRDVATYLGIEDLGDFNLLVHHNSYPKVAHRWEELPDAAREAAEKDTDWFRKKWEKELQL